MFLFNNLPSGTSFDDEVSEVVIDRRHTVVSKQE